MKPHKHAELIKAWADGAEIQYRYYMHTSSKGDIHSEWMNEENPDWNLDREYRIKPEPKPDVVKYVMFNTETREPFLVSMVKADSFLFQSKVLMVRMDGETGELKSAEVLK